MKPANFAPTYACLYPQLAEIARSHGYALAPHGSMARDFDLVCIPWIEKPSAPQAVVDEIVATFAIRQVDAPVMHLHSRLVYTIAVKFGECFIDLSFMLTDEMCEIANGEPHHRAMTGTATPDETAAPMDEMAMARLRDAAAQPGPISGWRKVSVYDLRVLLTYFDANLASPVAVVARTPTP